MSEFVKIGDVTFNLGLVQYVEVTDEGARLNFEDHVKRLDTRENKALELYFEKERIPDLLEKLVFEENGKRPPDRPVEVYPPELPLTMDKGAGGGPEATPGLIRGDGEFILRLLRSMRDIMEYPPGYKDAWDRVKELGLIEYHSSLVNGGFRLTSKGMDELDKILAFYSGGKEEKLDRK